MRIIAGEYRGRVIKAPKGDGTRPTTDRVRESLMSALASARGGLEGAVVLDAFAGSGALGFETLSRCAASACFFERDGAAASVVSGNMRTLGLEPRRARLVRAACESMAYQTYDVLKAMEADSHRALCALNVDGGGANNPFIMQFQADLLGIDVVRAATSETTALGAAFLAGLSCGFWADRDELVSLTEGERHYEPHMPAGRAAEFLEGWHEAVRRTLA